ncbi:MAG: hypothetical protein U1F77_15175 [Kiritimatiellia bacterium]
MNPGSSNVISRQPFVTGAAGVTRSTKEIRSGHAAVSIPVRAASVAKPPGTVPVCHRRWKNFPLSTICDVRRSVLAASAFQVPPLPLIRHDSFTGRRGSACVCRACSSDPPSVRGEYAVGPKALWLQFTT